MPPKSASKGSVAAQAAEKAPAPPVAPAAELKPVPAGGKKKAALGAKELYLAAYNLACMAGWAYVLWLGANEVAAAAARAPGVAPSAALLQGVWRAVRAPLFYVQWAAVLEVVHAAVGLVPSPVFTTALQVASRVILVAVAEAAATGGGRGGAAAVDSWHTALMVAAWALVEVPRYAFYAAGLLRGGAPPPYALFWLRYSLFIVLYPAGISGEWFTLRAAAPHLPAALTLPLPGGGGELALPSAARAIGWLLSLYFVAGPFMVFNMWGNRRAAFAKRFAKPPPPEVGVVFPPDGKGGRTTTVTSQAAIAAALRGAGSDEEAAAAADSAARDRRWKFSYPRHYRALVRLGARSAAAAAGSARAGLDWCYEHFQFVAAPGGPAEPFGAATAPAAARCAFGTAEVRGGAPAPSAGYTVPYDGGWAPGQDIWLPAGAPKLAGPALAAQLDAWVRAGVIEPDAADAVKWTSRLFTEASAGGGAAAAAAALGRTHFVMIGAGSAMGPYSKLLELGAHVVALDIAVPAVWTRLIATARRSPGRITFPTARPLLAGAAAAPSDAYLAALAGVNVIEQPAEIGRWLVDWQAMLPPGDRVVIGNYTYLDGDRHVKLALAADAIIVALRRARPSTAVAFLCTPTDVHVIPAAAAAAAKAALGAGLGSLGLEALARAVTGGAVLVPNARPAVAGPRGAGSVHIVDGLVTAQSFNYALAKRIQHWRAAVEFEAGATVSTVVAPSTATISVIHNKTFAWGYGGMPYFGYEIFKQDTTNAVMCAVLLHDVLNPLSPKNPANRAAAGVDSALELFRTEAVHGGLWRAPYTVDSLGAVSVLIYFGGLARPYLAAAAGVLAAAAALRLNATGGRLF